MTATLKKRFILAFICIICMLSVVMTTVLGAEFPDVMRTHKNFLAIYSLVDMGVIAGYEDGSFKPDREITRTEFCALMARTLGYKKETYTLVKVPFSDVPDGYWGEAYISFCFELGLINGMGDGLFAPADKVTLAQATKMAVCAIGRGEEALKHQGEKWYTGYVIEAEESNLFYRVEAPFNEPAIRSDVAQIVYNMTQTQIFDENDRQDEDEEPIEDETNEEDSIKEEDTEDLEEEDQEDTGISAEIVEAYLKKDFSEVRTILIDAGHNYTGKDIGAENKELSLREEEITWQIADKLRHLLISQGYDVVMTREKITDSIQNTSVLESLQARVDLAHEVLADLFISIHCNAGGGSGTEVYCFQKGGYSYTLAQLIQEKISSYTGLYDRGAKTSKFFVIQNTLMPAILIETGFIDNEADALIISSDEGQAEIANAICDAVKEYDEIDFTDILNKYQQEQQEEEDE